MIGFILKLMEVDDFRGRSENIDIAHGGNKLQTTFKGAWKQHKRKKAWRSKR